MEHARVLKFHTHFPHEKNSLSIFFMSELCPFSGLCPFEKKNENLVYKLSQKVFEIEPSYLTY